MAAGPIELVGFTTDKHVTPAEVGLVSACSPEEWIKAWKIDGWNTARVIVEGKYPRITTSINDQQVCVFDGSVSTAARYDKEDVFKQLGAEFLHRRVERSLHAAQT